MLAHSAPLFVGLPLVGRPRPGDKRRPYIARNSRLVPATLCGEVAAAQGKANRLNDFPQRLTGCIVSLHEVRK
jgi:hypothetical protein